MKKKPELRQLRQLRITEAIFLKKNLNYVNYVITPITQLQKRQNHPLVLPLVLLTSACIFGIFWQLLATFGNFWHFLAFFGSFLASF